MCSVILVAFKILIVFSQYSIKRDVWRNLYGYNSLLCVTGVRLLNQSIEDYRMTGTASLWEVNKGDVFDLF